MSTEEKKPGETPDAKAVPQAKPAAPPAPKPPPPPKLEDVLRTPVPSPALDALKEAFPGEVEEVTYHAGEVSARVKTGRLVEIFGFLKDDPRTRFDLLSDLCAVDYPEDSERFEVNYHIYSIPLNHRIRIKARVAEGGALPTVSVVWATANWHEREAFDLFGIRFDGHPDLTRILLPDDWKGHPLRKEYPLEGYPEQHPRFR